MKLTDEEEAAKEPIDTNELFDLSENGNKVAEYMATTRYLKDYDRVNRGRGDELYTDPTKDIALSLSDIAVQLAEQNLLLYRILLRLDAMGGRQEDVNE